MDTRLLHYVDRKMSPEGRWLLLQWSLIVGLDQSLTSSRQELYWRLGLSVNQGKAALESLKLHGSVTSKSARGGRGRPISSYQVSHWLLRSLEKAEEAFPLHQPDIEAICRRVVTATAARNKEQSKNLLSGKQRSALLAPATCWLLAVLLAHAESPGVIRGLSYSRLIGITGMTKERLKSQLRKLKKLRIIVRHEPGILRRSEQIRMSSVYILDLAHPLLWGEGSLGFQVVLSSSSVRGEENTFSGFYEAARIASKLVESRKKISEKIKQISESGVHDHRAAGLATRYADAYAKALRNARSILPPLKLSKHVANRFLKIDSLGAGPLLEAHIQSYVMTLLSNHWADLDLERSTLSDPVLAVMAAVQRSCTSLVTAGDREDAPSSSQAFFVFIYSLAHHLAAQLQSFLKVVEEEQVDCDFPAAAFLIEPFSSGSSRGWKLKVHFRPSEGVTYLNGAIFQLPSVGLSVPKDLDLLTGVESA